MVVFRNVFRMWKYSRKKSWQRWSIFVVWSFSAFWRCPGASPGPPQMRPWRFWTHRNPTILTTLTTCGWSAI